MKQEVIFGDALYLVNEEQNAVTLFGVPVSDKKSKWSNFITVFKWIRMSSIVIPETIVYNGTSLPVTHIRELCFIGCYKLKSITIPSTIESIEEDTFKDCNMLKEIIIPKGTMEKFVAMKGLAEMKNKLVESN